MSTPGGTVQAPGWYDDPAGQARLRYWDGAHWTAQTSNAKSAGQAGVTVGLGPGFASLGDWLGRLLAANGVVAVLFLGVIVWAYGVLTPYGSSLGGVLLPGSAAVTPQMQADVRHVAAVLMLVYVLVALVQLVTAIVWWVWQYQLARSAPGPLKRSPGMQVVAWFIPFVAIWWPYQDMGSLWRAYGSTPDEAREANPGTMAGWWIAFRVVPVVVGMLSTWATAGGSSGLSRLALVIALFMLSQLVAAFLARDVVRKLSWRALVFYANIR